MFGVERSHGLELLGSNDLRTKVSCWVEASICCSYLLLEWCFMMWNMFIGKKSYLKGWFIIFLEWRVVKMLIVISFEPLWLFEFYVWPTWCPVILISHFCSKHLFPQNIQKLRKDLYSSLNRLLEAGQEPTDSSFHRDFVTSSQTW